jgi:hypothetical protein
MRGRGSNPKSRYNLRRGGQPTIYWVSEAVSGVGAKRIEGPYSFDKAWKISAAKNLAEKTTKYFVDAEKLEVGPWGMR